MPEVPRPDTGAGRVATGLVGTGRIGIESAALGLLAEHRALLRESNHYCDPVSGRIVMRLAFALRDGSAFKAAFAARAATLGLDWQLHDAATRPRALILVSRFDHCLRDLLDRTRSGLLGMEVAAVISNHDAAAYRALDVPFHHLPVDERSRPAQETALLRLVATEGAELLVLARYMQVLSPGLVARLPCPAINVHHSLLPAFKGARPYSQAHACGVKVIGATAHYVTAGLDDGPIIEQDTARVDHRHGPEDLARIGRDLECRVLARAVGLHLERRVFTDGAKTIVLA